MPSLPSQLPRRAGALVLAALATGPAAAAVTSAAAGGFALHHELVFPGPPAAAWARLVAPAAWWSSKHSYSGDARNMTLAAVPGGCWCEALPDGGFVRHMDVLYAAPGRALRLYGGLGPLQGLGAMGPMTFVLKPDGATTRIVVDYVVSGYAADGFSQIAGAVDQVLGEQLASLAKP